MTNALKEALVAAHRFNAKLYAVGVNRCVDVPPEVSVALGGEPHIRVAGRVGDEPYRSNLAPRGGGNHRLFVHSDIWRKLGVDVGDFVEVEIERDEVEWEITVPADLAEAMPEGSEALEAFQALTIPNRKGSSTGSRRPRLRQPASGESNRASNCSSSDCEERARARLY